MACADGVTVITQYFLTGDARTQRDLAMALARNLRNPHVSRIVLFWDTEAGAGSPSPFGQNSGQKKSPGQGSSLGELQAVLAGHLAQVEAEAEAEGGTETGGGQGQRKREPLPRGKVFIAPLASRLLFSTAVAYVFCAEGWWYI